MLLTTRPGAARRTCPRGVHAVGLVSCVDASLDVSVPFRHSCTKFHVVFLTELVGDLMHARVYRDWMDEWTSHSDEVPNDHLLLKVRVIFGYVEFANRCHPF